MTVEINNLSGFASVTLALLVLFTSARAQTLTGWGPVKRGAAKWAIAFDVALCAATVFLLIVLAPVLVSAIGKLSIGHVRGAIRSLFALVYLGFVMLTAYQTWIAYERISAYRTLKFAG